MAKKAGEKPVAPPKEEDDVTTEQMETGQQAEPEEAVVDIPGLDDPPPKPQPKLTLDQSPGHVDEVPAGKRMVHMPSPGETRRSEATVLVEKSDPPLLIQDEDGELFVVPNGDTLPSAPPRVKGPPAPAQERTHRPPIPPPAHTALKGRRSVVPEEEASWPGSVSPQPKDPTVTGSISDPLPIVTGAPPIPKKVAHGIPGTGLEEVDSDGFKQTSLPPYAGEGCGRKIMRWMSWVAAAVAGVIVIAVCVVGAFEYMRRGAEITRQAQYITKLEEENAECDQRVESLEDKADDVAIAVEVAHPLPEPAVVPDVPTGTVPCTDPGNPKVFEDQGTLYYTGPLTGGTAWTAKIAGCAGSPPVAKWTCGEETRTLSADCFRVDANRVEQSDAHGVVLKATAECPAMECTKRADQPGDCTVIN